MYGSKGRLTFESYIRRRRYLKNRSKNERPEPSSF
jgi:hypothetical protein